MLDLRRARLLASLLALSLLLGSWPVGAATPGLVQSEEGLRVAMDAMGQLATDKTRTKVKKKRRSGQKTTRPRKGLPIDVGKDGRLTVLLIGSDWRPNQRGERFDVVMVGSIDPHSGRAALASIPRDMAGIPLAGGGNSGGMRVNSLYFLRYRDPSLRHEGVDRKAVRRFRKDIERFLGTEIDYWALTRFGTFSSLVNSIGGIRVDIREPVVDNSYHHRTSRGVYFPAQAAYRLRGDPQCKPKPAKCRSALVYARSRKGTMGDEYNSDFRRAERQQDLVKAAVKDVIEERGAGIRLLGTLLAARDHVETDLPKTTEAAAQLYALVQRMRLPRTSMKVLAPATWSYLASDGTLRPNLAAIRRWVDRNFAKVRPVAADSAGRAGG